MRDIALAELKHNVVALAKAPLVFKLPLVVTTTAARSMWGPTIAELAEVLVPTNSREMFPQHTEFVKSAVQ